MFKKKIVFLQAHEQIMEKIKSLITILKKNKNYEPIIIAFGAHDKNMVSHMRKYLKILKI